VSSRNWKKERNRQISKIRFREMMGEETGELYKACLDNIPSLFKDSDHSGAGIQDRHETGFIKIPNS